MHPLIHRKQHGHHGHSSQRRDLHRSHSHSSGGSRSHSNSSPHLRSHAVPSPPAAAGDAAEAGASLSATASPALHGTGHHHHHHHHSGLPTHGHAASASHLHPSLTTSMSLKRSTSTSSMHSHSSLNIMHAQDEELYAELQERGPLTIRRLQSALSDAGMHPLDPRLKQVHSRLSANLTDELSFENFKYIIESASLLIYRALTRKLVIPDWTLFTREIDKLYREASTNNKGHVASYIPELANADPNTWAVAFCSVDGQQHGAGDINLPFSVQSCSKPLSYLMALEELGEEVVHRFVGREPSGRNFNELCLNAQQIPHNPMINAGAIMVVSLIQHTKPQADRFAHILHYWKQLTGYSRDVSFSNTVYLSEKATANRNFCLAYLMQERKAFQYGMNKDLPPRPWKDTDLAANLDAYFQMCSIEATAEAMSVVAATLANGGVCPLTNERVFQADHVSNCLALMLSCGMYDYSGEWGFVVGLPAKSGVSGLIMLVIPNVGGLALLSPRLDELGNSARGIEFSKRLAQRFGLHFLNFKGGNTAGSAAAQAAAEAAAVAQAEEDAVAAAMAASQNPHLGGAGGGGGGVGGGMGPRSHSGTSLGGMSGKLGEKRSAAEAATAAALAASSHAQEVPLIRKPLRAYQDLGIAFIFACAQGDMGLVRALLASAVDLNASDYDGRTPLHLAASNGHLDIVTMLVRKGVDLNPVDRLGGTPLADAIREGHLEIVNYLRSVGAQLADTSTGDDYSDHSGDEGDDAQRDDDGQYDDQLQYDSHDFRLDDDAVVEHAHNREDGEDGVVEDGDDDEEDDTQQRRNRT